MSTNKRQALGKGLSALLESANTDITSKHDTNNPGSVAGGVATIPIAHIEANPFQPRTDFEKEALMELAMSIKEHGIIQPVTVRKLGYDKYQLISGERRFKASQIAGLKEIPAYIRIANDQAMLEMAIIENIQREDLNPIEIAISYKRLLDECNFTQEELAERVSKQRSTVANYMRLLRLPDEIQIAIRDKRISFGHARAIVNIDNRQVLESIFDSIIKEGLSVRQVEEITRNQNSYRKELEKEKPTRIKRPQEIEDKKVKDSLNEKFNTNVLFTRNKKGKGKIIIPFESSFQLEKIMKVLDL